MPTCLMKLQGKIILVTGGNSGTSPSIRWARQGAVSFGLASFRDGG
jgi:NAD(P)-dependent dehydrogenase (short-subunit alcohol dehydrogenase family)